MRESFVFYKSYCDAIEHLGKREQLKAYRAIVRYGIYGEKPELTGGAALIAELAVPLIDKAAQRYKNCVENGKKGGRPKNQEQNQTG